MTEACPKGSHTDEIQKVSGIVSRESGYGPQRDIDGFWSTGRYSSNLAEMLVAPPQPRTPRIAPPDKWERANAFRGSLGCAIPLVIALFILILHVVMNGNPDMIDGSLCAVPICAALWAIGFAVFQWNKGVKLEKSKRVWSQYATDTDAWSQAMIHYDNSYYCARHDLVFDSVTGETCQPGRFERFLYRG